MPDETRHRLRALISLMQYHAAGGLTTPEIAEHFGITRQTALKDIQRLETDGIPIYQEGDRYFIDPDYKTEIHLSLAEAWVLYLPLRRIVRADLGRIPLIRNLLYTITSLLHEELADQLVPTTGDDRPDPDRVFITLAQCWHQSCYVELQYRRPNATQARTLVVAPWWFEPAVWSDASYLVGGLLQANGEHQPVTLKLDRILVANPLPTQFERPAGRDITAVIEQTWGIWMGEGEAVRVRLRFHNRQYDRLRETRWHPSQRIAFDEEGYVIWEATISEPQEMVPWIRGWGPDVEVLEPSSIREQVASEAVATARLYGRESDAASFF